MAYEHVNEAWPVARDQLPPLDPAEAKAAARKLFRYARTLGTGTPDNIARVKARVKCPAKIAFTSGRRYNWIRRGVLYLNPGRGWWHLVHDLSHLCAFRIFPGTAPHSAQHNFTERSMIEFAVKSGWLDGALKADPVPPKTKTNPLDAIESRIAKWESKRKRADTALKKLYRRRKYYQAKGV